MFEFQFILRQVHKCKLAGNHNLCYGSSNSTMFHTPNRSSDLATKTKEHILYLCSRLSQTCHHDASKHSRKHLLRNHREKHKLVTMLLSSFPPKESRSRKALRGLQQQIATLQSRRIKHTRLFCRFAKFQILDIQLYSHNQFLSNLLIYHRLQKLYSPFALDSNYHPSNQNLSHIHL